MMVIDTRGLNYTESFRSISSMVYDRNKDFEELIVIAESQEKSYVIKGFAETLLGCSASMEKGSNTLFIRILEN